MKYFLILLFVFIFNNKVFADHKKFKCTNMFAPWNLLSINHNSILAPWNRFIYDTFTAPWNRSLCNKETTNSYMKDRGINERYFWK